MPTNKKMLTALRKLLYSDKDLKDTYQIERKMVNMTHPLILKSLYRMWDHKVCVEDHEIPVRIFAPHKEDKSYPLMIFFHGGGFVTGNIDSYSRVCTRMANITNHIILSVDYRLAPEHPFPAGLEDCYAVVKEVVESNRSFDKPIKSITLIGDSAGANLAAAVSLLARDRGEFKVDRQILLYPATNSDHSDASPYPSVKENGQDYLLTQKRMMDYIDLYVTDKKDLKNPYVAPILAEDLTNQPETLIITAEYDLLRDEGEDYGRRLQEAGNKVEVHRLADSIHGFIALVPLFPEVRECYNIINRFLDKGEKHESL
ncbi:MAG: alpha/beta hydrolase [Cellulosilyticum sp.]|nr:alpha/beta hydrolase [Cellulosilyticum sp.]MEE1071008.1 alpha/beta hydrolase [Cellulosilyticum sp.]